MPSSRAARAANRATELAQLRARLIAGDPINAEDVDLARLRAEQSRQWAREGFLRAAERHEAAAHAHAHDKAALAHENKAPGNAYHRAAADNHRRAADADRSAAESARRQAAEEERALREIS